MNENMQQIERPGNDDACWCGSGQEYQKCHRRSDREAAESQAYRGELLVRVQEYAMQPDLRDELQAAVAFFYGPEQSIQDEDDEESRLFNLQRGLDYFIHDCRLGDGRRVIEHFSRERGKQLPPPVKAVLKRWLHSRLAVYEVIDLRGGQVLLRDLLTQEEYWVHDLDMSKGVSPWDLILTRLFPSRDTADASGIGLHMPARFRDWIRSYMLDLWEEYRERHENESYEDFLHASAQLLNQFVLGEVEEAMNQVPNLVTREGDLVEACQARFRVLDFALTLAGLRAAEEFREAMEPGDDEKHFIWVEAGESFELLREHGPEIARAPRATEGGERLLGHVWLDEQELELETHSERRLLSGKELLGRRCGSAIEHIEDEIQPLEEALADLSQDEADELPEDLGELEGVATGQDMEGWAHRPMPELEGKTPREAVATLGGRVRVIRLIKELQNLESVNARDPWRGVSLELGLDEKELRDESKLEDKLAAELDRIDELAKEDKPVLALERWRAFRKNFRVKSARDLEFAEVWDLYELYDLTMTGVLDRLAGAGEYDRAVELAEELAEFADNDADEWLAWAEEVRIERGEVDQALPRLVELFERNLDDPDIVETLADVQRFLLHQPEASVGTLRRALPEVADQDRRFDLTEHILEILSELGRFQEAEEFWHKENDALDAAERDYRSWTLLMLARGDLERARKAAANIEGERAKHFWLGRVEALAGNYSAARQEWAEELEMYEFEWRFERERVAEFYLYLHDPNALLDMLRSLDSLGFREQSYIGLAYALLGENEQAARRIREASEGLEKGSRATDAARERDYVRRLARQIGLAPEVRAAIGL